MERSLEKHPISYGSPKTFEEAVYRLPNNSHPRIEKDPEIKILSRIKQNIDDISKGIYRETLEGRIMRITKAALEFMEDWSFKRKWGSVTTEWDQKVTDRTLMFNMIPIEEKYKKELTIRDMVPELNRVWQDEEESFKFICVEVWSRHNENAKANKREYFLGFVTQEEYDLLIGHEPS